MNPFESLLTVVFGGVLLCARGAPADELIRVDLVSSYDGEETWSLVNVPDSYVPGTPTPLVIGCHGMGGGADDAISFLKGPTSSRGWILAAPHTHGERSDGETSLAARAAQHDLIDLLQYCMDQYDIDPDRVYLSGASMGGMQTSISAAKYPDVFAAAWEWMGPADMEVIWYELDGSFLFQDLADDSVIECGGDPSEQPFEYRRRSATEYAMNLRTVPFKIGHGRTDILVHPHHARDLDQAIEAYDPLYYDGIYWHWGSHWVLPRHARMTVSWFEDKVLQPSPDFLLLTVDETMRIHYLDVEPTQPDLRFARLQSEIFPSTNSWDLQVQGAARVGIYLADVALDGGADLQLDVKRAGEVDLEWIGVTGQVGAVLRDGEPFGDYSLEFGRLVLHATGQGIRTEAYSVLMN
jgi:predicted esterase